MGGAPAGPNGLPGRHTSHGAHNQKKDLCLSILGGQSAANVADPAPRPAQDADDDVAAAAA